MERPKTDFGIENSLYESLGADLDDEDIENLFGDCHAFIQELLERNNPKWVQNDGNRLLKRLEEALSWYRIH